MEPTSLLLIMIIMTLIMLVLTLYIIIRIFTKSAESKIYMVANERIKDDEMLCPVCHKQMTAGYSLSSKGIYFHPRGEKLNLFKSTPENGLLKHSLDFSFRLKQRENLAWHCPECQIVTIDHSHFLE